MAKYSVKERLEALTDGYCESERKMRFACWLGETENASIIYHEALKENKLMMVARSVNQSLYERTKRVRQRNEAIILSKNGVFLTLTFNEQTLNNTNYKTRRVYVSRFLKSQSDFYIANVDYGGDYGREHYHAVIYGKVDYTLWQRYGAVNGRAMRITDINDVIALSKYITKITKHALKQSTLEKQEGELFGFPRIIYSKQKLWL